MASVDILRVQVAGHQKGEIEANLLDACSSRAWSARNESKKMTAMLGMPLTWFSIQHSTFSTPGFVGVIYEEEGVQGLGFRPEEPLGLWVLRAFGALE